MFRHTLSSSALIGLAVGAMACRWQSSTPTTEQTGQFGSGTGYTAQCSGDFPDWISQNPPAQQSFQMAQTYPLGIPVFASGAAVDHWDPPAANEDAPWRAFTNLSDPTERDNYLGALKSYILEGMSDSGVEFDATKNNSRIDSRQWFHVPMMTAAGVKRREPYHGVTAERGLRPSEQIHWVNAGPLLRAVAIGYYNFLGGYTIGQVFNSYDLTKTDPGKGHFIDGTLVFKLLFAEYVPARIISPDPLLHAPAWSVQDPAAPASPLTEVRLLQVDVAVKDDHLSSTTGWVFATFVYDEGLTASEPNPWRRLTPIGIQWGNDPSVTTTSMAALNETWINPATPAAFTFNDHHGRAGRLIGPVDNPVSSCLSCHSTAEVDMSKTGPSNAAAFMGATAIPPPACAAPADQMQWFRNLPSGPGGSQAFGSGLACPVNTSTAGLTPLDYSLQLQEGLQSVFGFQNANPCFDFAKQHHDQAGDAEAAITRGSMRMTKMPARSIMRAVQTVKLKPTGSLVGAEPGELNRR